MAKERRVVHVRPQWRSQTLSQAVLLPSIPPFETKILNRIRHERHLRPDHKVIIYHAQARRYNVWKRVALNAIIPYVFAVPCQRFLVIFGLDAFAQFDYFSFYAWRQLVS
jgi:hypothetical protein